ncbi:uncharacterized protein MYCFIDRAFT_205514 [Pseudocercospora fijiensis CIRAD86]|uniref:Uncharacterized protein n=1 Tax=Pseudocercospora fijiensis (strain CIRAD86) TaxID=383855 RepID=M2ZDA3_PSEFD|nr:uncharacterized protein MYCFIDRAFT_205514 [Pseudocercospora fijiensis CIRAD86]EME77094.1 hypothetical protein MYCFIDRAFT_205514 [Pseudocercospora fijiensis CIRAD86]
MNIKTHRQSNANTHNPTPNMTGAPQQPTIRLKPFYRNFFIPILTLLFSFRYTDEDILSKLRKISKKRYCWGLWQGFEVEEQLCLAGNRHGCRRWRSLDMFSPPLQKCDECRKVVRAKRRLGGRKKMVMVIVMLILVLGATWWMMSWREDVVLRLEKEGEKEVLEKGKEMCKGKGCEKEREWEAVTRTATDTNWATTRCDGTDSAGRRTSTICVSALSTTTVESFYI